ncbi:hypothetical protein C8R47DRAFT_1076194 [Mycena vitilis]|nr:hypothetical protein C8R47DRAFT_1076194 [Mycena vitilis]
MQRHTELNSRHPATAFRSQREIDRLERQKALNGSHARFQDGPSVIDSPTLSAMATSISGYRSTIVDGRDVMTDFADDMSEVIRTTIEHRIGERIELPPHVRPAKIDNRSRYSGQDDHETFMTSLEKFLAWMRTCGYGGPELDTYRISLLSGVFLEGDALQWFTTEIDNPRFPGRNQLDFIGIICALHHRYVKSASAQHASRAFEAVRWDPVTGPEKFMSNLITRGQAMVEMPSQFLLKDKFLKGIPNWLGKELKMRRGVTAEFTTLEFIRTNARQLWETDVAMRDEEASRTHAAVVPAARAIASNTRPNTSSPRPSFRATDAARPARASPPTAVTAPKEYSAPKREAAATKACFTCGGVDHFAKDKVCPRYNERDITRERPRVAAQRVEESYSDEDYDPFSEAENEDALLSEESEDRDPRTAPDLDDLIAAANEADRESERFGAMRSPLHYYSMRIIEEDLPADSPDDGEVALETSAETAEGAYDAPSDTMLLSPLFVAAQPSVSAVVALGNYNPGPLCVVCHDCSLVVRRIAATPENGLPTDGEYTVCVHLSNIGLDASWIPLPVSPTLVTVPLPETTEPTPVYASASRFMTASTRDRVCRGYPPEPPRREVNADGDLLNGLGDPDLPPGILIDVREFPDGSHFQSAEEEVTAFDAKRRLEGLRVYTAHEHDVNVRRLRRYRYYEDHDGIDRETRLQEWSESQDEQLREDPTLGPQFRAREAITAEAAALAEEKQLDAYGAQVPYQEDPA